MPMHMDTSHRLGVRRLEVPKSGFKTRPKCEALDCQNGALCLVGSRWLCGDHTAKVYLAEKAEQEAARRERDERIGRIING